jgi:hypothetical protein
MPDAVDPRVADLATFFLDGDERITTTLRSEQELDARLALVIQYAIERFLEYETRDGR